MERRDGRFTCGADSLEPTPPRRGQPGPAAADEIRERHPGSPAWRADALAPSVHSRLDALEAPGGDLDPDQAGAICARICRDLLQDFAPALLLLPVGERRRVQALTAYVYTLFDFALEHGIEGVRLSQINRWEYALDQALAGDGAIDQPVFLRMREEDRQRPWSREALEELGQAARHAVVAATVRVQDQEGVHARPIAGGVVRALLGPDTSPTTMELAAALLRVGLLQRLGRTPWIPEPMAERGPRNGEGDAEPASHRRAPSHRATEEARRRLLATAPGLADLPVSYRRAGAYLFLAALRLITAMEGDGTTGPERPPRLGLLTRIRLLLTARRTARRLG